MGTLIPHKQHKSTRDSNWLVQRLWCTLLRLPLRSEIQKHLRIKIYKSIKKYQKHRIRNIRGSCCSLSACVPHPGSLFASDSGEATEMKPDALCVFSSTLGLAVVFIPTVSPKHIEAEPRLHESCLRAAENMAPKVIQATPEEWSWSLLTIVSHDIMDSIFSCFPEASSPLMRLSFAKFGGFNSAKLLKNGCKRLGIFPSDVISSVLWVDTHTRHSFTIMSHVKWCDIACIEWTRIRALLQRPFSCPLAAMSSSYFRSKSRCSCRRLNPRQSLDHTETPCSYVHQDPALPQCNPFSGSSKISSMPWVGAWIMREISSPMNLPSQSDALVDLTLVSLVWWIWWCPYINDSQELNVGGPLFWKSYHVHSMVQVLTWIHCNI